MSAPSVTTTIVNVPNLAVSERVVSRLGTCTYTSDKTYTVSVTYLESSPAGSWSRDTGNEDVPAADRVFINGDNVQVTGFAGGTDTARAMGAIVYTATGGNDNVHGVHKFKVEIVNEDGKACGLHYFIVGDIATTTTPAVTDCLTTPGSKPYFDAVLFLNYNPDVDQDQCALLNTEIGDTKFFGQYRTDIAVATNGPCMSGIGTEECDFISTTTTEDPYTTPPEVSLSPYAIDDSTSVDEGECVDIDVVNNDYDPDGPDIDPTTVEITSGPDHGSAVVDPVTGVVTYCHNGDDATADLFLYRVQNLNSTWTNVATVFITIVQDSTAPPLSPYAIDDGAQVNEGECIEIPVVNNDYDPDGPNIDPTTVVVTSDPSHGTAVVDPVTGVVTYCHNGDDATSDSFLYRVKNLNGTWTNIATVTISIIQDTTAAPSLSPYAIDDGASVDEGECVDIPIVSNDYDPDGPAIDPTTVFVTSNPNHGTVSINPTTGVATYCHNGNDADVDSFLYRVQNLNGTWTNVATVTIAIRHDPQGSITDPGETYTP